MQKKMPVIAVLVILLGYLAWLLIAKPFAPELPLQTRVFAFGSLKGPVRIKYWLNLEPVFVSGNLIEYNGKQYVHCADQKPGYLEVYRAGEFLGTGFQQADGLYQVTRLVIEIRSHGFR